MQLVHFQRIVKLGMFVEDVSESIIKKEKVDDIDISSKF